jgi:ABC-2 type transport system permease protein
MRFGRLWAMARKEFLHILRDPRSLAMAIAIPMMQLVLFGWALTLDVDRVPMVVWDQSETHTSREFGSRFWGSRYFALRGHVRNYAELERAIDSGDALVALVIPRDFARLVESERTAPVQLIVDGSDSNTATIAMGYADAVARTYSQELTVAAIQRIGSRLLNQPVVVQPRAWFNEELQSKNYIIPGLIAVIMNVIAALLTSLTVAREWENGTMEQLISTPVRGKELVLGKLIPYFCIGMIDVVLAVLLGKYVFLVPIRGSVVLIFIMAAIFLTGVLSVGMFLSVVTRSQLLSSQVAMILTYLPALLLSGYIFAIANMPKALQVISHVFPARYFVKVLRGIFLKGLTLEQMALEAGLLTLFGVLVLALATARFKKKLEGGPPGWVA